MQVVASSVPKTLTFSETEKKSPLGKPGARQGKERPTYYHEELLQPFLVGERRGVRPVRSPWSELTATEAQHPCRRGGCGTKSSNPGALPLVELHSELKPFWNGRGDKLYSRPLKKKPARSSSGT